MIPDRSGGFSFPVLPAKPQKNKPPPDKGGGCNTRHQTQTSETQIRQTTDRAFRHRADTNQTDFRQTSDFRQTQFRQTSDIKFRQNFQTSEPRRKFVVVRWGTTLSVRGCPLVEGGGRTDPIVRPAIVGRSSAIVSWISPTSGRDFCATLRAAGRSNCTRSCCSRTHRRGQRSCCRRPCLCNPPVRHSRTTG